MLGRINEIGGAVTIGAASLALLLNPVVQSPYYLIQNNSRVIVGSEVQGDSALIVSDAWYSKGDGAYSNVDRLIAVILERQGYHVSDIPAIRRHALTQYIYNSYSPDEVEVVLRGGEGVEAKLDDLFEVVRLDVSGSVKSISHRIEVASDALRDRGTPVPARDEHQLPIDYAQQLELMLVKNERLPDREAISRRPADVGGAINLGSTVVVPEISAKGAGIQPALTAANQELVRLLQQNAVSAQDLTSFSRLLEKLNAKVNDSLTSHS